MSSGRTLHVLHRGCVLATVLTLTSMLPGCAQLTSKADSAWTITGITQRLAALEILPASNTLANVVQAVLPSGYQATYADGIDINQPVDRPAAELSWNDQVKEIATASGLAVRVDGKRIYFEKEAAVVTSVAVPPKLVDATIMGMPRNGRHHPEAPAPLMTPQEAALLEKAQAAAAASTSASASASAPAPAPAPIPATAPTETTVQPSADVPSQQETSAAPAAVLAPETVPLVIITEEPTASAAASPTPPAVEATVGDKPVTLTPVVEPVPVEPQQAPVVQEAEKSVPVSPAAPAVETAAADKPVALTPAAEPASVESQQAPVVPPVVAPVNPRLANITVMGTPQGSKPRLNNAVQPAVSSPAPVSKNASPTPPVTEAVVLAQAPAELVKVAEPAVPASEAVKPAAEVLPISAPSEPEKTAPAAGAVAERPAEAPVAMVPSTPEEHALASAAPTAPDLSASVGSNFDTSNGRPVAAIGAWSAERGQTLHEVLQGWCERANVELNWSSNYDFPLKASVSIDDTFENAVRTLLTGFSGASPQPVGRLHRQANAGSRLLVIETRGNRYED